MLINVTNIAKKFNAKPESWLRTNTAKQIIANIANKYNCSLNDLVRVETNTMQKVTWMQEDVVLVFAQWLSPEFYIWCNDRIKELFKYGITATQEKFSL